MKKSAAVAFSYLIGILVLAAILYASLFYDGITAKERVITFLIGVPIMIGFFFGLRKATK